MPHAGEKPLSRAARAWLVVNAALTILLFYVVAAVAMALLATLTLILLIVVVGAARFGLASYVTRVMHVPVRLMGSLGRRLWLASGPTYRIELAAPDAPDLFAITRDLARRSGLAAPDSISIEMHANAWVHLRGYRRGAGRTSLGIGFDLLAGLTVSEIEAVLAHELTHARLVQRGFSRWLMRGLARLGQVSMELSATAEAYRRANQWSDLADAAAKVFGGLTRRAARLVATYSRQDEFEADHGAAELCGGAATRSALARLEVLNERVSALPWSERLARLQPGEPFTAWLVTELSGGSTERAVIHAPLHYAIDPYSTHPAMHDRLAALPADDRPLRDTRPAVELLVEPDRMASRLIVEIQRVLAAQEAKDAKRLARDTRKFCRKGEIGVARGLGVIAIILALGIGLAGAGDGFTLDMIVAMGISLAAGMALFRVRYRDRRPLPVPAFGTLLNPRPPEETQEQLRAAEQAVVAELRAASGRERGKRDRAAMLVGVSYAALEARDYLRAHVAARLALEIHPKSIEAGLGYAIAAAGLGSVQQFQTRLVYIRNKAGLHRDALKWGIAWALSLFGDWSCEGLLQQLHDLHPDVATYATLLALAQLNRGKLQSAIGNAERGVALDPTNRAAALLLAQTLLMAGRTADAAARMEPLGDQNRTDVNAAFLMMRIRVMQRDTAGAIEWAEVVRAIDTEGQYLIGLGHVFSAARLVDPAAGFFEKAVEAGFTPEAQIGLSIVAWLRGDRMRARGHLLGALKFDGAKFTKGHNLNNLFHEILGRLNGLAEQRLECRAWVATFPAGPQTLGGRSILVCAQSEVAARLHLETIVNAMAGKEPAGDLARVSWRLAPQKQQPDRPVPPGVHSVVA